MKYIVEVKEVWNQPVEIEAENPEDAITKVAHGYGETIGDRFEPSHNLDSSLWTVREAETENIVR